MGSTGAHIVVLRFFDASNKNLALTKELDLKCKSKTIVMGKYWQRLARRCDFRSGPLKIEEVGIQMIVGARELEEQQEEEGEQRGKRIRRNCFKRFVSKMDLNVNDHLNLLPAKSCWILRPNARLVPKARPYQVSIS